MANRSMQRVFRLTCFQNFKSRPANHQVMMVTSDAESARDIPIHYSWMQNRMICTQKCKFHSWRIHASWLPLAHREICNPSPQTSALLPSFLPSAAIRLPPMVQNSTPLIGTGARHALLFCLSAAPPILM